jgi:hypothetical protein
MGAGERRKFVRVETSNLISHDSISNKGRIVSRSMGKALNISQSGIMLETSNPITAERISLTTVDLDNNLIEIKGKPIYYKRTDSGMYQVGISFLGSKEETTSFAVKLVKLYHHRKHNLIMKVAA